MIFFNCAILWITFVFKDPVLSRREQNTHPL